jgi:hypothetical protein
MKYVVAFYTRTNNSQRIAKKIADKLACEVVEISDSINWKGLKGFFKAGAHSSKDTRVEIEVSGNMDGADAYIVVVPLWAGGLAPAAKTFLKTIPNDKVHLVVTSIGNQFKNRSGFKSVSDVRKISGKEDLIIDNLVNNLKNNKTK